MAKQYTDTQRLDWLVSKGGMEIEDEYLGPVTIMQSGDRLGRAVDLRAAIDMGLRRDKVKPVGQHDERAAAGVGEVDRG